MLKQSIHLIPARQKLYQAKLGFYFVPRLAGNVLYRECDHLSSNS